MRGIVLLPIIFACCANASRIIFIFPGFQYSHFKIGYTLANELATRGHEVTFVSSRPPTNPVGNLQYIQLTQTYAKYKEGKMRNLFDFGNLPSIILIPLLGSIGLAATEGALNDEELQNLLNSDVSFDLVITKSFLNDALHGIAHHYKAPSVLLTTIVPTIWTNHIVGLPDIPSYMPHMLFSTSGDKMTFWERICNTFLCLYQKLYDHIYFYPKQNQMLKDYFPGAPGIYDLVYNTSLVLVNSHISFNKPVILAPNMIEIGGFHVQPPQKLPDDLEKIIDESKDGVIYFSIGSIIKADQLQQEVKDGILKVFSKLKQTVLWKFEGDFVNKPQNLIIRNWFPQNDILAHPNVKLFISHGGLLSTIETIYHGKPMIGIPIFGDQTMNIANAVISGYAVAIPIKEFSEDRFAAALNEVLINPKYAQIAKQRSQIMHDQETKPIDKAVYWVEYVIKHKGAPHLKAPSLHLTSYQFYMVDVILLLLLVVMVLCAVIYKMIGRCFLRNSKGTSRSTRDKEKLT